MTEASIAAVKTMIKGDTQYTIRDTARYVGITTATAFKLLTEHLGLIGSYVLLHLLIKEPKAYRVKSQGITQNI